jgi:cytochrome oxidase Cu insertion factor (SCO1/SenC/PrrC family)
VSAAARRGLIVFLLGLVLILGAVAYSLWSGADDAGYVGVPIGGAFALTDQHGVLRHDGDFRGKLMLIYFGYTFCPDVCPTELQTMSEAIDRLGAKGDAVQPIFITVDPARDTQEQLKAYAENFHPRLLALTGSAEQIAQAARAYKVFYQPVKQGDGEYLMDHSSVVYLMDRDGHYLAHFGGNLTAEQMAAAIAKHL